jgi:hypothetical protein
MFRAQPMRRIVPSAAFGCLASRPTQAFFVCMIPRRPALFSQAVSVPGLRLLERATLLGQEADRTLACVAKLHHLGVPALFSRQERLVRSMREASEAQASAASRLLLLEERSATAVDRWGRVDPRLFSDADKAVVREDLHVCRTTEFRRAIVFVGCVRVWRPCMRSGPPPLVHLPH